MEKAENGGHISHMISGIYAQAIEISNIINDSCQDEFRRMRENPKEMLPKPQEDIFNDRKYLSIKHEDLAEIIAKEWDDIHMMILPTISH